MPTAAPAVPVDLSGAAAFHGTLDASVGTLVANRITFNDLHVVLKGDGKTLSANPFSAKVWQGGLQGSAQVVPAVQQVSLNAKATGIRIEQVLRDLAASDRIEGSGQIAVDIKTSGKTVGEMTSALNGRAQVLLRDGAVKGFNLASMMRQAKAALTLKKDEVQKARSTEQTDFSEITASFEIAQGVAHNQDLLAKSPFLRVTGDGDINVGRSSINYTVRATVVESAGGQGGADLAALRGVQVPVVLTGPLAAMDYKVQWSAVTTAAAKEALKGKLGDQLKGALGLPVKKADGTPADIKPADAREQLKNQLKGLFK